MEIIIGIIELFNYIGCNYSIDEQTLKKKKWKIAKEWK